MSAHWSRNVTQSRYVHKFNRGKTLQLSHNIKDGATHTLLDDSASDILCLLFIIHYYCLNIYYLAEDSDDSLIEQLDRAKMRRVKV